jgi:hypothetical protein
MADNEITDEIEYIEDMYVNPVDEYVGSRLQLMISKKKFTYLDLGISEEALEDYIHGYRRIGAANLFQISMMLDVPVKYFFEGFEPTYDMEVKLEGHVSPQLLLSKFYQATIPKRLKVMKLLNINI